MPIGYPMPINSENIHAIHILHNQYGVIRITYVNTYTYMHATTIDKKRGHEIKREQEEEYGRVWDKKIDGQCDVVI